MDKSDFPIFFDISKKRWRNTKIATFFLIMLGIIGALSISYSYLYSPFSSTYAWNGNIPEVMEEINNESRLVRGQGTFFELVDIDNRKYLQKISNDQKIVVFSFDDGPDPKFTRQIIEIFERENIKGTFFSTGAQLYKHPDVAREIVAQGSDIGLHTFSHDENEEEKKLSPWTFLFEMDFPEKIFAHNMGYKTRIFRVPFLGGEENPSYNSLQYIGEGLRRNMSVSAPTIDSFDWRTDDVDQIVINATADAPDNAIILFHDAGGDRTPTIAALPEIIDYYRQNGYEFMTISEMAAKFGLPSRETLTLQEQVLSTIAYTAYDAYKKTPKILNVGFIAGFVFVLAHSLLFVSLAITHVILSKFRRFSKRRNYKGLISVVIPVYNEEKAIAPAISALLRTRKKNMEVIIVDDGCTDLSFEKISPFLSDKRLKIVTQENYGKYMALNRGIEEAKGEITVLIDADTRVSPESIGKITSYFTDNKIGAVAGNIIVGNQKNMITHLQNIEYTSMQAIEKRALDLFGCVTVVPGAFGAFRTSVVKKCGGFSHKTLAEDFDLTMEMIKGGFKIRFATDAYAYTEAPSTVKELLSQRFRWSFGNLQVLFKNRSLIFNPKYGILGMFILPRSVIVQIPSMVASPIIDVIAIASFFLISAYLTSAFIVIYLILQLALIHGAFLLARRKFSHPEMVFMMRFPYTQLMFMSFFMAINKALRGELQKWSKIQHTGEITPVRMYNKRIANAHNR